MIPHQEGRKDDTITKWVLGVQEDQCKPAKNKETMGVGCVNVLISVQNQSSSALEGFPLMTQSTHNQVITDQIEKSK